MQTNKNKLDFNRIKERINILIHQDDMKWEKPFADESKKRLLIYAHYYYPDVASTGQILTELAEGLKNSFNITVICTVPSYTGQTTNYYKKHKYYFETLNGVNLLRIRVPRFRKNFSVSRINNIVSYFLSAIVATFKVGRQDYVFTISQPPVLGGMLGIMGKLIKRARFIYNIQDFNPEQVMAVSFTTNKLILSTMLTLDKIACRMSDKIILVGRDMIETLNNRFGKNVPEYCHINNWIDEKSIVPLPKDNLKVSEFKERYGLKNKLVFMYSGNIGLYYDLQNLVKVMGEIDNQDVVFAFVGAGSVLEDIEKYKNENKLDNIIFIPYQNKEDLVYSLNSGDIHFVVNAKGIKGVSVPSKVYGVMAAGKPVLGVLEAGSEARLIIEESDSGLVVEPEDYNGFKQLILKYIELSKMDGKLESIGNNGRAFLDNNLSRDISINKYKEEILSI